MDKKDTGLAAVVAATDAVPKSVHDKAIADANAAAETLLTEGVAKAKADGFKEGATAERTRVKAILGGEQAKGREALAQHFAFDTAATVEQALAALDKSPKAEAAKAGNRLDAAMADAQPKVDAVDGTKEGVANAASAGLNNAVTAQLAKIGKTPKTH